MKTKFYSKLIIINIVLVLFSGNNIISLKFSYKNDIVKFFLNKDTPKQKRDAYIENYKVEHKKRVNKSSIILIILIGTLFILIILKKKNSVRIQQCETNNEE